MILGVCVYNLLVFVTKPLFFLWHHIAAEQLTYGNSTQHAEPFSGSW